MDGSVPDKSETALQGNFQIRVMDAFKVLVQSQVKATFISLGGLSLYGCFPLLS